MLISCSYSSLINLLFGFKRECFDLREKKRIRVRHYKRDLKQMNPKIIK